MEVLNLSHTLEYAGIAIILASMFLICSVKLLAIIQQCGYNNGKTLRWYSRKDNMLYQRYSLLTLMLLLLSGLIGICFTVLGVEVSYRLSLLPFVVFCGLFYFMDKRYALKVPVKETERLKRLALVYFVLFAMILYILVAVLNVIAYLANNDLVSVWRYVPLSLMPLAIPFVMFAANAVDSIYENANNKKYIARAKAKLSADGAIKIGITGSYGKTSVKNILAAMLAEKYSVLATPASFNTPMGIAKTVNENKSDYNVFIAEMGARNVGDIAFLSDMVCPDFGILTGVCEQHIESFGSVENVLQAKSELIAGVKNCVAVGIDEHTASLKDNKIIPVTDEICKDIVSDENGTRFTFVYNGEELNISTKLLSKHTAKNIALAAIIAMKLGVSGEQIISACEKMDYVPHRLQKIEGQNGVTVIDDSYNTNVKGAAEAVEVLRSFPGRKIIVTPGIVELGILEEEKNGELGKLLVGLDLVILIGDTLVGAVQKGYEEAGGDKEKVKVYHSLEEAKKDMPQMFVAGDTVLFLNDLPDAF